ncbi:MAG: formylmethanofuran dehydrogenase subunit E family protein [Nitrospirae bacterium]|nr:formylmethanofuran dehydrogenase subunit E family protein [Nitrospirota bacterium]
MNKIAASALCLIILSAVAIHAADIQNHTGSGDNKAEWYFPAWLGKSPYSPVFQVRDTENKYGRYTKETKTITIKDLIKFHGHFCGGLVESAGSLRVAFNTLFPDGIIDRTDLRIVSNNSACGADVASYLTGARARFGSHVIDNSLTESEFYVQQISTGRTVHVKLNPAMYPKEVKTQMRKIESGMFEPKDINLFQELQWAYAKRMVNKPLKESFIVREAKDFKWPGSTCKDLGTRKDNDYKNTPTQ